MIILYPTEQAFNKAKRFLDENQYIYKVIKQKNGYRVEVKK